MWAYGDCTTDDRNAPTDWNRVPIRISVGDSPSWAGVVSVVLRSNAVESAPMDWRCALAAWWHDTSARPTMGQWHPGEGGQTVNRARRSELIRRPLGPGSHAVSTGG